MTSFVLFLDMSARADSRVNSCPCVLTGNSDQDWSVWGEHLRSRMFPVWELELGANKIEVYSTDFCSGRSCPTVCVYLKAGTGKPFLIRTTSGFASNAAIDQKTQALVVVGSAGFSPFGAKAGSATLLNFPLDEQHLKKEAACPAA